MKIDRQDMRRDIASPRTFCTQLQLDPSAHREYSIKSTYQGYGQNACKHCEYVKLNNLRSRNIFILAFVYIFWN